jgi:hypothetical protein
MGLRLADKLGIRRRKERSQEVTVILHLSTLLPLL